MQITLGVRLYLILLLCVPNDPRYINRDVDVIFTGSLEYNGSEIIPVLLDLVELIGELEGHLSIVDDGSG